MLTQVARRAATAAIERAEQLHAGEQRSGRPAGLRFHGPPPYVVSTVLKSTVSVLGRAIEARHATVEGALRQLDAQRADAQQSEHAEVRHRHHVLGVDGLAESLDLSHFRLQIVAPGATGLAQEAQPLGETAEDSLVQRRGSVVLHFTQCERQQRGVPALVVAPGGA